MTPPSHSCIQCADLAAQLRVALAALAVATAPTRGSSVQLEGPRLPASHKH